MYQTALKFIVISSSVASINCLAPRSLTSNNYRQQNNIAFSTTSYRPRYTSQTTRRGGLQLSYRRFPKNGSGDVEDNSSGSTATKPPTNDELNQTTTTDINDTIIQQPPTIDFDQLQHNNIDVLDTINQQNIKESVSDGVSILSVDDDHYHLVSQKSSSELENKTSPTIANNNNNKRSETKQMISEIAAIALPSLGGMLLDPIMSLIDTACVGQVSTKSLAAMAPSTSIFQFCFFAFFFLSAATTNLVASNPPESVYNANDSKAVDEAKRRVDFNERVVSNASALAVILGTICTASIIKFSDPLLKLAGIPSASLLTAARPYLIIRALGLPFVFLATVLQGSSLGRGNAWRPLKIFGAAGLINLVGDVYLTLYKGWGATGAATATLASQVGAAIYYVISSSRLDSSVEESSKPLRDVALVWRGLPSRKIVTTFMSVAVALFSRSIGLMLAFSMLTRTAGKSAFICFMI